MNNSVAIALAFLVVCLGLADALFNDAAGWIFLGRKGLTLIEYLAFWR